MLTSHLKAAKLKRWLANPDSPQIVQSIKSLFDRVYASKSGATSSEPPEEPEVDDKSPTSVAPVDLRPLLADKKNKVHLQARYKRGGIIYATSTAHAGNSQVLYYPGGDKQLAPVAGIIKYIYTEKSNLFMAVQQAQPVHSSIVDPFAKYPHWPARLYSSPSTSVQRILPTWVHCHFARWDWDKDRMVVLSLDRVSRSSSFHIQFYADSACNSQE